MLGFRGVLNDEEEKDIIRYFKSFQHPTYLL